MSADDSAVIVVPWRPGDDERNKAQQYVMRHYQRTGMPIVFADSGHDHFNRAASRNVGAFASGDWLVAAFVDADCIMPIEHLEAAMEVANEQDRVVIPHDEYLPLSPEGSKFALMEPVVAKWRPDWLQQPVIKRRRPSGVIVFPRSAWDIVGGYDSRLSGWGFEDAAMLRALDELAGGYARLQGRLFHFWHPPNHGAWLQEDKDLFNRYKAAEGNPVAMEALLNERLIGTLAT